MESGRDTAHDGPSRGRHRLGSPTAKRTPAAEETTDILPVMAGLFPDAPATGLAKFDLGSIPASVTPPRSWRHAAWFAVAASILVLVGLSYAAVSLVTAPRKPEVVEALPGLPSRTDGPIGLPPEPLLSDRPTTSASPSPSSAPPSPSPSPRPRPTEREQLTAPAPGLSPTAPVTSGETTSVPSSPARTIVETPVLVGPIADARAIGDRTETYFQQVTASPDAAYAMTSGAARRDGLDEIERRYAGVTRIEVQRITIDSNRAKTRSTLRLHRADGTVATEERELTFTYGADPKITNDVGTGG